MAEGKIRVKFEAVGEKALVAAVKELDKQTKRLAGSTTKYKNETKKTTKEQKKQRKTTRNLAGTFSVLRSKMLLGAFALTQFVRPFISLGKKAVMVSANFEALETRLVSMTGSVSLASKMMSEFRDIAATTPFAVQDVVEAGVQLRAFGVNAQEMIKPVTDLAAFMGTTAVEAASALGRAFAGGAGAADILRERGILQLIKDSQGITDLSKVTLPEFRKALENALVDPVAGIAGATDKLSKTTVGAFSNMGDALDDFLVVAAEVSGLKGIVTNIAIDIAKGTKILTEGIRPETFDELAFELKQTMFNAFLEYGKGLKIAGDRSLDFINDTTIPLIDRLKMLREVLNESSKGDFLQGRAFNPAINQAYHLSQAIMSIENSFISVMAVQDEFRIKNDELSGSFENLTTAIQIQKVQVREVNEETPHQISDLDKLNAFQLKHGSTIRKSAQAASSLSEALVTLSKGNKEQTITALKLAQASAIASSIAGAAKAFGQGGIAGFFAGAAMLAQMMVRIQTIQQQINEASSMESGGLIGGRRHSQGGTMINAERGEFVMSRNAVSSIGVENLNRMNDGGGGSQSISININGGMVDQNFVENELADAIKTAIRRGSDFGVA